MPPRSGPSQNYQISYAGVDALAGASERVGHDLHGAASALQPLVEEIESGVRVPGARGSHRPQPAPPLSTLQRASDAFAGIGADLRQHKVTIADWDSAARSLFGEAIARGATGGFAPTGTTWTSLFEELTGIHAEDGDSGLHQHRMLLDGRDRPSWLLDLHKEADQALDAGSMLSDISKSVKDPHEVASIMAYSPMVMAMRAAGRTESEIYSAVHTAHQAHGWMWQKEAGEFAAGVGGQAAHVVAWQNGLRVTEGFFGAPHGGFLGSSHHIAESLAPEARLASRFPKFAPVIGRALPGAGAVIGASLAPEQVGYVIDGKWNAKDVEAIAGLTSTGVAAYMAIAGATGPVGWAIGGTAAAVGLAAYHFSDHSEEDAAKQLQTDVHDLLAGHVAEGGGHGGGH